MVALLVRFIANTSRKRKKIPINFPISAIVFDSKWSKTTIS